MSIDPRSPRSGAALDRVALVLRGARGWMRRAAGCLFRLDADPDAPSRPGGWRRAGLAALGACAFGAVLLNAQLRHMDSVPDLGDPLFSMWRLGWVYHQLSGDPRSLFDANIFHPERLTLTYSDAMLWPALTAAPLLAIGLHPVIAYNVLFLGSFVLSAVAAYLLIDRLTGSPPAAFVAALLFGFHPYRFEHYSHLELQMTYWMPLALLALHRFFQTRTFRDAALVALAAAAQFYSSMYYGVFFGVYGLSIFVALWLFARAPRRELLVPSLIAGGLAIALAVPLARPYMAAQGAKGDREISAVTAYSATPADYLRAPRRSVTWGGRTLPGRREERALFPGAVSLALAAVGLVPPLGAIRVTYVAGLLVAFDASLGFNGVLYPFLYEHVPAVRGLRVPARFGIIVGLSLAVLAAFGVRRLLANASPWRMQAGLAIMITAIAIDLRPALQLRPAWMDPPPVYRSLAGASDVVLAEFPVEGRPPGYSDGNIPYMYFSLWHWSQMVNGYSGFQPRSYDAVVASLRAFPSPDAINVLERRGVTHVTVNCVLYRNQDRCDRVLAAVNASPAFREIASGRWAGGAVYLYSFIR